MTESANLTTSPFSPSKTTNQQDSEKLSNSPPLKTRSPSAVHSARSVSRSHSSSAQAIRDSESEAFADFSVRVEGLTRNVSSDHLREIFGKFGNVRRAQLLLDRNGNVCKGLGIVEYATKEDADNGVQHMNGGWLDGKKVQVLHTTLDWIRKQQEQKSPSANRVLTKAKVEPRKRSPVRRNARRNSSFSPRRMSRSPGRVQGANWTRPIHTRGARAHSRSPRRRRSVSRSNNRRRYASPFRPRRRKHSSPRSIMRDRTSRFSRNRGRSKSASRSLSRHGRKGRNVRRRSRRSSSSSSGSFVSSRSSSSRSFSASPSRSKSKSKSKSRGRTRSFSRSSRSRS